MTDLSCVCVTSGYFGDIYTISATLGNEQKNFVMYMRGMVIIQSGILIGDGME